MKKALLLLPLLLLCAVSCKTIGASHLRGGFAVVKPAVAHEMMLDNPQIVVFDFRSDEEYRGAQGHIAGSISVPFDRVEQRLPELMPYTNSTVLVYADTAEDSARAARLLVASGFRNVVLITGGIDRWIELGYQTVTSS